MLPSSSRTKPSTEPKSVLVCHNRTCLRQGAANVFAAFQTQLTLGCTVTKTSCMGQCGNGPMVRILPDNIWYCQVLPEEVPAVVERHLRGGRPIRAMLSPHFHTDVR